MYIIVWMYIILSLVLYNVSSVLYMILIQYHVYYSMGAYYTIISTVLVIKCYYVLIRVDVQDVSSNRYDHC